MSDSPITQNDENCLAWQRKARRFLWQVNLCWWFDHFLPLLTIANVLFGLLLLGLRTLGYPVLPGLYAYIGTLALLIIAGYLWARSHFQDLSDVLLRLDNYLGMQSRLIAARAGVLAWPRLVLHCPFPYQLRPGRFLYATSLSILILLAGLYLPLGVEEDIPWEVTRKPPALEAQESWIETLRENKIIEETSLESWEEKINSLGGQKSEEWYTRKNLEAGEHLQALRQSQLQTLGQELSQSSEIIGALAQMQESGTADPEALKAAREALQASLQQLGASELQLNADMLGQFRELVEQTAQGQLPLGQPLQLDAKTLQQMQALSEQLKEAGGVCQACAGGGKSKAGAGNGTGFDSFQVVPGNPGRGDPSQRMMGGIQRGPGAAPMALHMDPTKAEASQLEAVSNPDLSRAAISQTIGVTSRSGEETPENTGGIVSGGESATGSGGDIIWKNRLTPDERAVLQQYFDD